MIVECKQCGAPLDVASTTSIVQCSYCGANNRVKTMRTISQIAPVGWAPPPTWQPRYTPMNAPLPYRAPPRQVSAQAVVWIIVVVIMLTTVCPMMFIPFFILLAAAGGN